MNTSGFIYGVIVNVIAATLAALVGYLIGSSLFPITGYLLAIIATAASLIYFGRMGFRQIPVGEGGIQLIWGTRTHTEYSEGWAWNWPSPIGDIQNVNKKEQTLDLPLTEVLTDDNVPVMLNISTQWRVERLYAFLNVDSPKEALGQAIDSITRSIVQKVKSTDVAQEDLKSGLPNRVQKEKSEKFEDMEQTSLEDYALKQWGIRIIRVRITSIRLPEALENARTKIQVMKAEQEAEREQGEAEKIEARKVADIIEIYKSLGLSPELAANIAQSERGKATRVIIEGSASALEKAGALAGGILNQQQSTQSSPSTPKGTRRRNT